MIQVYADGALVYDSRVPALGLLGLKVTRGLNKGGTATLTLPPQHPAYNRFTSYRTVVDIHRDGLHLFRGRVLYPTDDFQLRRVVTCEGERCFLRDGVIRPYAYKDTPAGIFAAVIKLYNAQVEEFKQFEAGEVTVTDPNGTISLESPDAETFADTIDKLVERCGGYIVFTTNAAGRRVINWYAEISTRSTQRIELGANLLDFRRSTANSDLATVIIPYGARDEATGERLTIKNINSGLDYIQDDEAVALRGVICKAVVWDDVTMDHALLAKARQYLATSRQLITSLELTAYDLSLIDKTVDGFELGDQITVRSKPHGLADELYQLTEQDLDLLHPDQDRIVLGLSVATLTGADAAGDRQSSYAIQRVEKSINADYTANVAAAVQASEQMLTSLIQQTSDAILLEVAQQYTTNEQLEEAISTRLTQLEDQFLFEFETLRETVTANDTETRGSFAEIYNYIQFKDGAITLGGSDNAVTLTVENDMIVFKRNGAQFGWWDGVDFHTGNIVVEVNERAQFGNFAFVPRSDGSLSFLKVGG